MVELLQNFKHKEFKIFINIIIENYYIKPSNGNDCISGWEVPANDKTVGITSSDFHLYVTAEN